MAINNQSVNTFSLSETPTAIIPKEVQLLLHDFKNDKSCPLKVLTTDTFNQVKEKFAANIKIPKDSFKILCAGLEVVGSTTVEEHNRATYTRLQFTVSSSIDDDNLKKAKEMEAFSLSDPIKEKEIGKEKTLTISNTKSRLQHQITVLTTDTMDQLTVKAALQIGLPRDSFNLYLGGLAIKGSKTVQELSEQSTSVMLLIFKSVTVHTPKDAAIIDPSILPDDQTTYHNFTSDIVCSTTESYRIIGVFQR